MAINQLSAGVNVSEIDLTTTVPAVSTSTGAIAGPFQWGPVGVVSPISNEVQLVSRFGQPVDSITGSPATFFSAANFLQYSGSLNVVRAFGATGIGNSATGATGPAPTASLTLVKNGDDYNARFNGTTNIPGLSWIGRYPGTIGNSLRVITVDAATYSGATGFNTTPGFVAFNTLFPTAPGTSAYAAKINPYANDEAHVIVVDQTGAFSGIAGTILETFPFVSKAYDAVDSTGNSSYIKNVINTKSAYIRYGNVPGATGSGGAWGQTVVAIGATGFAALSAVSDLALSGGIDSTIADSDYENGYALFLNETVFADLIITGGADVTVAKYCDASIAQVRKDSVVFVSPSPSSLVVNNAGSEQTSLITWATATLNLNSSYSVLDGNYKYQYDKYNDVYRWIPLNGDIAGLCAQTDYTNAPWFSPAGYNRGVIKNVTKLAWNPTKSNRDAMYNVGINPVITQPGVGTVLFGDKTALAKPSAFDRINVRRLFIVLEKAISTAAKFSLFEINDTFTQNQFIGLVDPYLRQVKGQRGITDYKIVCDSTNNTPQIVDSNSFVGDIYIKPARSINFIQLNFVAVRSGVAFNEVVGQF